MMNRHVLGVLLLTVLLIACSREEPRTAGPASPSTATPESAVAATTAPAAPPASGAAAAPTPRLEPADCAAFGVDDGQGDHPVRCHYLIVPENRERPAGATIRLAVAIFAAADAPLGEAPLIWLDGGPGGDSVEQVASVITGPAGRLVLPGERSLVAERDLILIDQRGTGHSQPALACPEITPLDQPGRDPGVNASEAGQVRLNAALACRDRLSAAGVDLAAYTSRENAADINDLRIALGHAQVNLYGVSYGSRLALTVMRDFPDTVRSTVLDSPVPLQVDLFTGALTGAQRALNLIFDGCDADPGCRIVYPNLRETFHTLVSRLNTDPITFINVDPATGERRSAVLTGDDLVGAMFDLLYVTPAIPLFPAMIGNLDRGIVDGFLLILRGLAESGGLNHAMHYSVQCSDEVPFAVTHDQQAAASMVHPNLARALGPAFGERMRAICNAWPSHPAAPVENEPVTNAVPTLILSGQHDPITPPAYAEIAASTLPNSTAVTFPGVSHGALLSTRTCPYDITWAFLQEPGARPDTSCVAEMKDPDWVVRR